MEANPNVNVEFVVTPGGDYSTRLQTLMAGNQAPDIFYLGRVMPISILIQAGCLM
ncbi:extracellular solute-binding protein [Bacillus sp. JCM 19041]|uniref:extracellular solute-binding protein n=1 Tax=Bacillus sp. JCM 19041 TaxID=1460637 RepID=UPI0009EA2C7C